MSKKTKVYFCILGLLVFLFVFLAVFSNEPRQLFDLRKTGNDWRGFALGRIVS